MPSDHRKRGAARQARGEADPQRAMTIAELAKYLGVRKEKIYGFLRDGTDNPLPASRVGRSWRINLYDFQDWMCGRLEELEQRDHNDSNRHKD